MRHDFALAVVSLLLWCGASVVVALTYSLFATAAKGGS